MQSQHPLADKFAFASLCFLVVWAPIPLGSNRVWSAELLQLLVAVIAANCCWLLARKKISPSAALRSSKLTLGLFFCIAVWSSIQLLPLPYHDGWQELSHDLNSTAYKLQKSILYTLVLFITLQLVNTRPRLQVFAHVIVISGVLQAVYAVITLLGGPQFDILTIKGMSSYKGDATGTFINRNHLAGYLEMTLAVGTGLLIASLELGEGGKSWRERIRRLLQAMLGGKARLRLFLVIMVIALVMTHSRMGNAAFFASMGICAVIGLMLFRQNSRSMVILFSSMIIIDVFIVSTWFGLERLVQRIEGTEIATEERTDVNATALPWVQENWLTGSGAGSFSSQFPAYRTADISGFFDFAHNDYLQILGEYGVIGGSFFAAIVLLCLYSAIQAQRERRNSLQRGMAFAAMMGIMSLLIHSTVDFNLHIPANAMLFTILCSIALIARHLNTEKSESSRRNQKSMLNEA
ncbi:MAG: O-antigen ligase family protein [Moraxellaceae bacterium]|nr:O-antigen ligase family protein [Moraxellaceae bacterium]